MSGYTGPKIDCDVHHSWAVEEELLPYLSRDWREYFTSMVGARPSFLPPFRTYPLAEQPYRLDSMTPSGTPGNTDFETLREQLFDKMGTTRAILTYDIASSEGLRNPYLAEDVVRALNDWSIDNWLGLDDRLFGAIIVPAAIPDSAAREVLRLGRHPRIAEVQLYVNPLGLPFGHPVYEPIYRAAVEVDLPVAIHVAGDGVGYSQSNAGGLVSLRPEAHTLHYQALLTHLVSFITHGVFEKFPQLQLLIVELGLAWLPTLMWKLDANYRLLRRESPWVKRPPSDYIRSNVRVSTQPFDDAPEAAQLVQLLEGVEGIEDLLCFASDWPHYDADEDSYVARRLPKAWLPKIFYQNAMALYHWDTLEPQTTASGKVPVDA